jgi:hypothetical protein
MHAIPETWLDLKKAGNNGTLLGYLKKLNFKKSRKLTADVRERRTTDVRKINGRPHFELIFAKEDKRQENGPQIVVRNLLMKKL